MSEQTQNSMNDGTEKSEKAHGFLNSLESRVSGLLRDVPQAVHDVFRRHRRTAFERHPFLFSTLGLLGLVITWQAMDDIIEQFDYFDQNPEMLLFIGLSILLLTGRLYRQLDASNQ